VAASFSASVKLAPLVATRSISAALKSTRLPMRTGFSFPVRCSQWSVVSPIFKSTRASARVNKRGAAVSFTVVVVAAAKFFLPFRNAASFDGTWGEYASQKHSHGSGRVKISPMIAGRDHGKFQLWEKPGRQNGTGFLWNRSVLCRRNLALLRRIELRHVLRMPPGSLIHILLETVR
jgi:hypothetical protein